MRKPKCSMPRPQFGGDNRPTIIEPAGWKLDLPPPRAGSFADLRIAVMLGHPLSEVDAAITSKPEDLASFLRKQGACVDMTARTDYDLTKAHRLTLSCFAPPRASARAKPPLPTRSRKPIASRPRISATT